MSFSGMIRAQIYTVYLGTVGLHEGTGGSPTWTQLNGSGKGADGAWTRYCYFHPTKAIPVDYTTNPVGQRSGARRVGAEFYADAWSGRLLFECDYGGNDEDGALQLERMEEWKRVIDLMTAPNGEVYLRFDYTDRAGAPISRCLAVQLSGVMPWSETRPGGEPPGPKVVTPEFDFDVLYPYYVDRAGDSESFSGATATAATATVSNAGQLDQLGTALEIDAVNSATNTITVTNTTTGKSWVWSCAGGFTAGDRMSFFADDPREPQLSTANASHNGASDPDGDMYLARGDNDIEITSDGDVDVTLYWYDERFTV